MLVAEIREGVSARDVWVEFDWPHINQGQVPFLFTSLAMAVDAVADGGVINIQPGSTTERPTFGRDKSFTLVAPIGRRNNPGGIDRASCTTKEEINRERSDR